MTNGPEELVRLAGRLLQGVISPETLPEVVVSLAAWLQPAAGAESAGHGVAQETPPYCPQTHESSLDRAPCRRIRAAGSAPQHTEDHCAVCALLDGNRPDWHRIIDLFVHCRALREFADHAASWAHTSHVAAIILTPSARVLDCDYRGESFLKSGTVLRMMHGQLCCAEISFQPNFAAALKETAATGRTSNILLHAPQEPEKRFSLTLTRMQQRPSPVSSDMVSSAPDVLCLIAPLDGRRIATAQQLMDLFGLSGAEARLARALCHGDSVEEYARDQGLRLPTIRSQLSSIFNKTGTERQATLVRLIAGIPVVRDSL